MTKTQSQECILNLIFKRTISVLLSKLLPFLQVQGKVSPLKNCYI